jgi:hypothetical protein
MGFVPILLLGKECMKRPIKNSHNAKEDWYCVTHFLLLHPLYVVVYVYCTLLSIFYNYYYGFQLQSINSLFIHGFELRV